MTERESGPVAFRVTAERLMLLGWSRAILLQFAHPLVAAGVFEHSGFRASPLAAAARLRHTIDAMLAIAFGDETATARALAGIRAIHARVHGTLPHAVGPFAAGTKYSAEDPALVLWVHGTLADSMIHTFESLVAPLSAVERDAYCAESAWVAMALGARDGDVPRTWAAMRAYMDRTMASGVITVGPQARELARALMWSRFGLLIPGFGGTNRLLTTALLPPYFRSEYGLAWNARRERTAAVIAGTIRKARHVTPDSIALWASARQARRLARAA